MRMRRSVSILFLVLALSSAAALTRSAVRANDPASSKSHAMAATSPSQPNQAHLLYAALWRTDGSFVSTIRIKNILVVAPLQVTPILFMADGTSYPLPPVNLPISGVATVNINDALAVAPQSVASHISEFGSATLLYSYSSPGHVVASVAAIDVPRSLSFVYPIIEPMPMPDENTQQILEGLWWKHDGGVHGMIGLSNTTDKQRTVTLRTVREAGDQDLRELQLAPHATQIIELEQISQDASNPRNTAGGIRVEFQGRMESVLVSGSLANEREGYSANMPFSSSRSMTSTSTTGNMTAASAGSAGSMHTALAGVMIGKPDAMTMPGFPANTTFTPYLALRNTTTKPMDIGLQLNYMPEMDGGTPVNRTLPIQRLRPFEAKQVDMESMLGTVGVKNLNGTINLGIAFAGQSGDLLIASGSVDQTGTYVFEVRPQAISSTIGKITGYWSIANGNDTMYSLWNPTDAPQDLTATIYYGDGSGTYRLPIHLAPQASTMIDIAMLIMSKTRDANGKLIPTGVLEGSASFDTAGKDPATYDGKKPMTVIISSGIFNVADATCGENCAYCNGYSNFTVNPSSVTCIAGCGASFVAQATDSYGTVDPLNPDSWSSSNTNTLILNGSGDAELVGIGTAFANAYFNSIITWQGTMCVSDNMTPNCNPQYENPAAQVTVLDSTPAITGIYPSDWNAGAMTSVTFTGQYFGTNAPTLSFSPSGGISYTLSTYSDTQIVASVTVAAGTPNEQVSVSVTNNGYGGNSFNGGGAGQPATSAAIFATVHAPLNSPEITVIAWVNQSAPDLNPLPSGANQYLVTNLNSTPSTCGNEIFWWSVVGSPVDLLTSTDQAYANDWIVKYSANPAPPPTITPSNQLSAGNFRLFNDFGGSGGGGVEVGITPDPCGTSVPTFILNWLGKGQSSQYNGAYPTSGSGKVYQLAEGRVGKMGQTGSMTINGGRTVPWIWSVIEFDSSGNPIYSDVAMFPTYSVYVNGVLTVTYPQSSVASFVAKDETYQRTPSQVQ